MTNAWLERWDNDQIGWHQPHGHESIDRHWKRQSGSVLVPLCGKAFDLRKLAEIGHEVTGVELSKKAAVRFFQENNYAFEEVAGDFPEFKGKTVDIRIVVADFFEFAERGFSAVFDRAALIALPPDRRANYALHVRERLAPDAFQLLISLDYDQTLISGPPYAVPDREVEAYYPELQRVEAYSDMANRPPKFAAAGITQLRESIWVSK